jgi:hypothetical protein
MPGDNRPMSSILGGKIILRLEFDTQPKHQLNVMEILRQSD